MTVSLVLSFNFLRSSTNFVVSTDSYGLAGLLLLLSKTFSMSCWRLLQLAPMFHLYWSNL